VIHNGFDAAVGVSQLAQPLLLGFSLGHLCGNGCPGRLALERFEKPSRPMVFVSSLDAGNLKTKMCGAGVDAEAGRLVAGKQYQASRCFRMGSFNGDRVPFLRFAESSATTLSTYNVDRWQDAKLTIFLSWRPLGGPNIPGCGRMKERTETEAILKRK
jgi:hypothetical protein